MSEEYIVKSCEPKSDQLNADDLVSRPRVVTVTAVKRGDAQQPVWIELAEAKPYKPSKGMRRVLVAAWGDDPSVWIGRRMELFRDDNVSFGGVRVGGIRISALSGIKSDMTFLVTTDRGKRSEFHVRQLQDVPTLSSDEQQYIADIRQTFERAASLEELNKIIAVVAKQSESIKTALRPAYVACAAKFKGDGDAVSPPQAEQDKP